MRAAVPGLAAAALLLTGCIAHGSLEPGPAASPADAVVSPDDPRLEAALSTPVEDSVYPRVGDPGVDALHYDLDLHWDPGTETLRTTETLLFRATADADRFRLDLGRPLEVSSLRVDGDPAAYVHPGKDLVVDHPVSTGSRHTLVVDYAGTPKPVPAPTTRSDFDSLGWTVASDGGAWTMQEPFGAYSWYAVNDQPSDKALYDFTVSAPSPMVGVANGTLQSRVDRDGTTVTRWHLDEPAASYLVTVAIDDYLETRDRSESGVPMTYWVPSEQPERTADLRAAADELPWIEERLGPFPFSSLGIVLVDSHSGMETQTMITLGNTQYATTPDVLVHEMAHQWYGDQVTPADWRDVWMSEGMATYLQGLWQAEHSHVSARSVLGEWARFEPRMRRESGPPADYDPRTFGEGNVYYGPALMWDRLRQRLGDQRFWEIVRAWPRAHDDGNAGYDDVTAFWSRQSGEDLRPFFDAWLLGKTTPR